MLGMLGVYIDLKKASDLIYSIYTSIFILNNCSNSIVLRMLGWDDFIMGMN